MLSRDEIPYLLLFPPSSAELTAAAASLPYLAGAATAAGFTDATLFDANIESVHFALRPESLTAEARRGREVLRELEGHTELTLRQAAETHRALIVSRLDPDAIVRAAAMLRDSEAFYDLPRYLEALSLLSFWRETMAGEGLTGLLSLLDIGGLTIEDLIDPTGLESALEPLRAFTEGPMDGLLTKRPWRLIGISVNYLTQLPYSLLLSRRARARCPDALICLGGTAITGLFKWLRRPQRIWEIFSDADALICGEGESAVVELLEAVREERAPRPLDGLFRRGRAVPLDFREVAVTPTDLSTLATPRYDLIDLEKYLSPEPVILYTPTRGCNWRRCAFCDYGGTLDGSTVPYRERPVEGVIEDLRELSELGRTFCFAVDSIAPAGLQRLARGMIEAELDIRWTAEIRPEPPLIELAEALRDSGCVSMALGLESGCDRVNRFLRKGIRPSRLPAVFDALWSAGIGVQLMSFMGSPSETVDAAKETFELLLNHDSRWSLAEIGWFQLSANSTMARSPEDFGLLEVKPPGAGDLSMVLRWRHASVEPLDASSTELDLLVKELMARRLPLPGRPWLGGIEAPHSTLYFAEYGPKLIPQGEVPEASLPRGFVGFDRRFAWGALGSALRRDGLEGRIEPSPAGWKAWLDTPSGLAPFSEEVTSDDELSRQAESIMRLALEERREDSPQR